MSFADALRNAGNFARTENGAVALNTTRDARLDFFSTVGSLREAVDDRIHTLFAEAYGQDPLFAVKILFMPGIYGADWERERPSVHCCSMRRTIIRKQSGPIWI